MNQTIADSRNYDVVCMSFGKEKGKEIEVVEAGEKDSFLKETIEIKAGTCTASDMNFTKAQMETLRANRKLRKTARAIAQVKAEQR